MKRTVICADTAEWIKGVGDFESVVTSLPDKEETRFETFSEWEEWFVSIVESILNKTAYYAIFYQTDRKLEGSIIDKSYLLNTAAGRVGIKTIFHKIVLRRDVGTIDLFRPTFTHLMCFSKNETAGRATPDVMRAGDMIYKNAMGRSAVEFSLEFIKNNSPTAVITDPFCGKGTVLAMANTFGFDAVGVEILPTYCKESETLAITPRLL